MSHFNFRRRALPALLSAVFVLTSCTRNTDDPAPKQNDPAPKLTKVDPPGVVPADGVLRSDYEDGEVADLCDASLDAAETELNTIAAIPEADRTTQNTLLAFENALADLGDRANPLTFMGYVSPNDKVREEGADCEGALMQFYVEIFTRRDLYQALEKAKTKGAAEARLLKKTLEAFEANGLKLDDVKLAEVRALKTQLSALEVEFSENLNNDNTTIAFTEAELEGVAPDLLADLEKDADGKLILPVGGGFYQPVMRDAKNADTRKRMMTAYLTRAGAQNSPLLSQAVVLRAKIANLMGYKTWADYRTKGRMAEKGDNALQFLNDLKGKLAKRNLEDLDKLLAYKKQSIPSATALDQWDISYYTNLVQKRDYNIDHAAISEYFPMEVVVSGMFEVYSKMLGVTFKEVTGKTLWHESVKLYEIHDAADGKLIAYFYADFFPRDNKYGHAAAFPLISGRKLANGSYSLPIASIVSNMTPPMNGKPSLLTFDDVETLFHEFGHIMHQTLTRAPYASLSGTSVAQDFVEAPSQVLENWTVNPGVLKVISGHYKDHSKKLPADLLQQLIDVKDFNQGYNYTKQLTYALFDMKLHTQDQALDVNQVYIDTYREVMQQEPLAGQQFPASFGHMMGGYDAGYYGYLWSEVYAQDMFTKFPETDITDSAVGMSYRKNILEPGNMKDAMDLLRAFLGREPSPEAFFKKLGI